MPWQRGDQEAQTTTIAVPCPRSASVRRPPPTQVRSTVSARTRAGSAASDSSARVRTAAAPRRTREEDRVVMGAISVGAGSGAATVREMGEDAVPETFGGRTADRPLADDQQQLAGVADLLRAVAAPSYVVPEGGQHRVVHLAVEKQEQNRADLFTIHRPSSGNPTSEQSTVTCPRLCPHCSTRVCGGKFPGTALLSRSGLL